MTEEELAQKLSKIEADIQTLQARETRNEVVAIALTRLLFKQGILPLTPDLKDLLIDPNEIGE